LKQYQKPEKRRGGKKLHGAAVKKKYEKQGGTWVEK